MHIAIIVSLCDFGSPVLIQCTDFQKLKRPSIQKRTNQDFIKYRFGVNFLRKYKNVSTLKNSYRFSGFLLISSQDFTVYVSTAEHAQMSTIFRTQVVHVFVMFLNSLKQMLTVARTENIANNLTNSGGFLSEHFLLFFGCIVPDSFHPSLQGLYFLLIRIR